ncbi:sigma-70 family RNA polymerase sigma factor [Flagellimonas sp. SN16]|uniref:sigma-70 family RNA polymerase sigma factor n=1 Tax=Flagellimonas sp. SN16 TaxID=3415142 RepID=UPI003C688556
MRPLTISKQLTDRESPALSRYLKDVSRIPMITEDEEVGLAIRIRNGDSQALEKLVTANLRFVISVAKQYQQRGMTLHDLINEGNLGLVRAAMKFDETRGFKFISYAVWWIRQGILQALSENSRMVRLPLNKINVINKIKTITAYFEQVHQRPPFAEEVSEMTDITLSEIKVCMKHSSWPLSMDETLKPDEGSATLYDRLGSGDLNNPESSLIEDSLKDEISELLEILSLREAYIIRMLFGIGTEEALSVNQIANDLDLTTERVRQIKIRALTCLKKSSKCELLKEYLK